ncbi:MAG: PorT family protein [Bacteroidales bacterium]|nr:PorT family protein [Bacteroidales bacterium]
MKKIVILFITVGLSFGLSAQYLATPKWLANQNKGFKSPIQNLFNYQEERGYNFGFLLGANYMDFAVKMQDDFKSNDTLFGVESGGVVGFTVGALYCKRLHELFEFRSGIIFSFGARGLIYSLQESPNKVIQMTKSIESTTLDVPLEIKWKGMRYRSLRPYVIGGFRYSLDMASNAKKNQNIEDKFDIVVKLKRDDFLFTTGAGFDFYLPRGNRIGVEIKMAFGMRDILVRENNLFTNGIDRLTSRNLQIAINIE